MNTSMVAAGIRTFSTMWRSMVRAWRTERLIWIPIGVATRMAVDHRGRSWIRVLRSSTCCTVHISHGFEVVPFSCMSPSVLSAARLSDLYETNGQDSLYVCVCVKKNIYIVWIYITLNT